MYVLYVTDNVVNALQIFIKSGAKSAINIIICKMQAPKKIKKIDNIAYYI